MKLYMKQHVFTWGDRFSIYDQNGEVAYSAEGEVFSFGKKLHIYDRNEHEVAFVEQELFTFMPTYHLHFGNQSVVVKKHFTFFTQEYSIEPYGWTVNGDFFDRDYSIYDGTRTLASVFREYFTFGDAYAIEISSDIDPAAALGIVLVIDAVISNQRG